MLESEISESCRRTSTNNARSKSCWNPRGDHPRLHSQDSPENSMPRRQMRDARLSASKTLRRLRHWLCHREFCYVRLFEHELVPGGQHHIHVELRGWLKYRHASRSFCTDYAQHCSKGYEGAEIRRKTWQFRIDCNVEFERYFVPLSGRSSWRKHHLWDWKHRSGDSQSRLHEPNRMMSDLCVSCLCLAPLSVNQFLDVMIVDRFRSTRLSQDTVGLLWQWRSNRAS